MTKDWKREKLPLKGNVAFWRSKKENGFISISKVQKGAPAYSTKATRRSGKYQIVLNTGRRMRTEYAGSQSEARKIAKRFM